MKEDKPRTPHPTQGYRRQGNALWVGLCSFHKTTELLGEIVKAGHHICSPSMCKIHKWPKGVTQARSFENR